MGFRKMHDMEIEFSNHRIHIYIGALGFSVVSSYFSHAIIIIIAIEWDVNVWLMGL